MVYLLFATCVLLIYLLKKTIGLLAEAQKEVWKYKRKYTLEKKKKE
jgi:hypothetical protein